MSATSEALLLEIIELERKVIEIKSRGEDSTHLEESLMNLRTKFATLNEALGKRQDVLKG